MEYRYLKAFLLTAKHKSFSKAADSLKIAQSAVSRQIKLLEESIGHELIIRSSKKVLLTNKGEEFYKALQHFDRMAIEILEGEDAQILNVGILSGLLKTWFFPILVRYTKKYTRNINISVGDINELIAGVEMGKYDIAFSTQNIQTDLVSSLKLFSEKIVIISKSPVNRKKLHEHRWIVYGPEDNLYKLSRKTSDSIIQVASISTIVGLVKSGVGIAAVPDHVLKKNDNIEIQELSQAEQSVVYMTTLNYKSMPNYIKELADLISLS